MCLHPSGNRKGRTLVRSALKQASGMGLNVMRIFAHTTDPNFVLQANPGEYNEKVQLHSAKAGVQFVQRALSTACTNACDMRLPAAC